MKEAAGLREAAWMIVIVLGLTLTVASCSHDQVTSWKGEIVGDIVGSE